MTIFGLSENRSKTTSRLSGVPFEGALTALRSLLIPNPVPIPTPSRTCVEFEPEAGASGTDLDNDKTTDAQALQETGSVNGDPREYR
jgi:hypothetical protein